MELSLNPKKTLPMWFLGKPRDIKVSLTFANPGPVEIDFFSLDEREQEKILLDLKNEILVSDVSFHDLHTAWSGKRQEKKTEELQERLKKEEVVKEVSFRPQAPQPLPLKPKRPTRTEDKLDKRAEFLVKKSFPAIRTALSDKNTDIRLIRKVCQREEKKKRPRVSVLNWLGKKLRKHEKQVAQKLGSIKDTKKKIPRDIADMFEVIEDEPEVVEVVIDRSQKNETIKVDD